MDLPVKDLNLYFKSYSVKDFKILIEKTSPEKKETAKEKDPDPTYFKRTQHGFITHFTGRQYHIKGIHKSPTQLKATLKVSTDLNGSAPFELSTIDLYSSRSRRWFEKLCADLFNDSQEAIKADLGKLLPLIEGYNPKEKKEPKTTPTKAQQKEALNFLKNPDMFKELLLDLETLGVVGEKTNKLVTYLAAVSRKLEKPLSVLIQSRSSAGKSTLQNAVLSLVPDEDYEKYTRVTDQALFYKEEEALVHKIVAIEEEAGMGGAAYSIRNIQSSNKISVAATGKDPGTGRMKTETYTVKGPVAVMITTTSPELDQETASRFIFLTIDESPEMTQAIHQKQREAETIEGLMKKTKSEDIIKKHHIAQRLLKPIVVVNNFSKYLTYPSRSILTRRDHEKYLGLIRSIAYLHQYQQPLLTMKAGEKEIQYIEVTLEDIDFANKLAKEVLSQSLDELAKPSRTLLGHIFDMVRALSQKKDKPLEETYFNRRMIREYCNWSDWQVKTHIRQLEDLEYLYVRVGSKGKQYAYAMNYKGQNHKGDALFLNLTSVEEIKKLLKE